MKPFLKWAGNKYPIIERVQAALPNIGSRLIEPFVGSGALFLNSKFSKYLLTDNNIDLVHTYLYLQNDGAAFIDYCKAFFVPDNNNEEIFYQFRKLFNTTPDTRLKSALFIYLNKHCFNGLCRYNSKGIFNTPFGKYKNPYFPEKEMLFFQQKARAAEFKQANFIETLAEARLGDIVYCDPPYAPLTKTANFTSYSSDRFTLEQQEQLANLAQELAKKGIPVIISNHQTDFILDIYRNADIQTFNVQRNISCNGSTRGKVTEVLAIFT